MTPRRTLAATLAALGLAVAAPAHAAVPDRGAATTAATTTRVAVQVTGCRGCELTAHSWRHPGGKDVLWSSATKVVPRSGLVTFAVPTARTRGLSVQVDAPWANHVGAVGHLVMHYAGQRVGEPVGAGEARAARRGSVCFVGTTAPRIAFDVRVLRVHFPGVAGRATAAAAFVTTTKRTLDEPVTVTQGFWGTQDAPPCYDV